MAGLSRRSVVTGGLCGCMLGGAGRAGAAVAPAALQPLVRADYRPADADEKGIWQSCERLEQDLAASNTLLRDPAMQAYTMGVMRRLLGDRAKAVRVYIVHDPSFNASMTPTGMMIVHTGLLARVRCEAQYAAVLGHETGHYLRRHTLAQWRDHRTKSGVMAFVSAGSLTLAAGTARAGGDGRGWIDLANSINTNLALSLFAFSREQESEADAYGMKLIDEAGYSPDAAEAMWRQFTEERRASASARHKRYRDASGSAFSTHPPTAARMLDLATQARAIADAPGDRSRDDGRDGWRTVVAPLRASLLAEQIALNDPGASLYLVRALAEDGWNGVLRYYEGEAYRLRDEGADAAHALRCYTEAIAFADAPAEAWRAQGYALLKAERGEDGRRALAHYLELNPQATDAAMVRVSLNRQDIVR